MGRHKQDCKCVDCRKYPYVIMLTIREAEILQEDTGTQLKGIKQYLIEVEQSSNAGEETKMINIETCQKRKMSMKITSICLSKKDYNFIKKNKINLSKLVSEAVKELEINKVD